MDSQTKGIVKSAMVMYHLGYKWAYDGVNTWSLYNNDGKRVYRTHKECFPPQGNSAMDFVKKSVLLLPNVFDGEDFDLIFDIHQGMAAIHNGTYSDNVKSLDKYLDVKDFSNTVINESLACIFGE